MIFYYYMMIVFTFNGIRCNTINWQKLDAFSLNSTTAARNYGKPINFDLCNIPGIWVCDFIEMFGERSSEETRNDSNITLKTMT